MPFLLLSLIEVESKAKRLCLNSYKIQARKQCHKSCLFLEKGEKIWLCTYTP